MKLLAFINAFLLDSDACTRYNWWKSRGIFLLSQFKAKLIDKSVAKVCKFCENPNSHFPKIHDLSMMREDLRRKAIED